jgi:hypothetical protein
VHRCRQVALFLGPWLLVMHALLTPQLHVCRCGVLSGCPAPVYPPNQAVCVGTTRTASACVSRQLVVLVQGVQRLATVVPALVILGCIWGQGQGPAKGTRSYAIEGFFVYHYARLCR